MPKKPPKNYKLLAKMKTKKGAYTQASDFRRGGYNAQVYGTNVYGEKKQILSPRKSGKGTIRVRSHARKGTKGVRAHTRKR